ncbi:MAG: prepilin peptidase [Planctomycetaceae bacterium]|nr:prepilin peptidase [Planctomycetaceae bacterium]
MDQYEPVVFLVVVIGYTILTGIWDQFYYKIPNKFTIPMFFAGWVYQGVFDQLPGLGNAALGFLVGFGFLFMLWMVGSAGGGDAKLMGGLSVWLGFKWSLYVLFASTLVVIAVTLVIVVFNFLTIGPKSLKKKLLATGKPSKLGEKRSAETIEQKKERRIMAWALPISLATWGLLALAHFKGWPVFPWDMV